MKTSGWILIIVSLVIGFIGFFALSTTVDTAYGSVHNIGKMQTRQNVLLGAALLFFGGLLLIITDTLKRAAPPQGLKAFVNAIENNDTSTITRLLDSGQISPNGRGPEGHSWLRICLNNGLVQPCQILLIRGADPTINDEFGSILDYIDTAGPALTPAIETVRKMIKDPLTAQIQTNSDDSPYRTKVSLSDDLVNLKNLKESGHLTEAEFNKAKSALLG